MGQRGGNQDLVWVESDPDQTSIASDREIIWVKFLSYWEIIWVRLNINFVGPTNSLRQVGP